MQLDMFMTNGSRTPSQSETSPLRTPDSSPPANGGSPEDSHVRTSARPILTARDWEAVDPVSGSRCSDILGFFDPGSCLLKTFLQSDAKGSGQPSLQDLPPSGMIASGILYELPTSAASNVVSGGFAPRGPAGLWPTPTGSNYNGVDRRGDSRNGTLLHTALFQWATPTNSGNYNRKGCSKKSGDGLITQLKNWATPLAREYKETHTPDEAPINAILGRQLKSWKGAMESRAEFLDLLIGLGLWLMGFPSDWLSRPSERRLFRR